MSCAGRQGRGLALSPHALRHTCLTALVRQGTDLVLVAELAGHRRVDTTRRYSLPSEADRRMAMRGFRSISDADPVSVAQRDRTT